MSQENVVVVRRYYEAAERTFAAYWEDPRSAVEAVKSGEIGPEAAEGLRYLHPNAEWKTALTGVTFRGYSGMAEGFDQLVDAAGTYRVELQEVTDLGGDHVLAVVGAAMKGIASGIDVTSTIFVVV